MTIEADAAQIADKFQQLGERVTRRIERQILRKAGKVVQRRARAHAPVRTGELRKSIVVRAGKRARLRQSILVGPLQRVHYAKIVEFKTKAYMRPAREESEADVLNTFADELRRAILEESI